LRIMFSSGNIDEREYIGTFYCREGGETKVLWDLFSGIGYFALQAARCEKVGKVVAVEINPLSYYYLMKNIIYNRLEGKIVPILGDNRQVFLENSADSVISGYFIEDDLPRYSSIISDLFSPEGGTLHFHFLSKKYEMGEKSSAIIRSLRRHLSKKGLEVGGYRVRRVKSYAPLVYHYVLEVDVLPRKHT